MGSVNRVTLVGRLGTNPEVKYSQAGTAVCNLRIATSDAFKDKSGTRQERTEWHRATCFKELAELCGKYLEKGREVYLEGRLQTRSYEKDGQKHYSTEIVADKVVFLGGKADGKPPGQRQEQRESAPEPEAPDDDVPF